jgi:hypothetical protein
MLTEEWNEGNQQMYIHNNMKNNLGLKFFRRGRVDHISSLFCTELKRLDGLTNTGVGRSREPVEEVDVNGCL